MEVHAEVARERTHAGEPIGDRELPPCDGRHDLVADLLVDGCLVRLVNAEDHRWPPTC